MKCASFAGDARGSVSVRWLIFLCQGGISYAKLGHGEVMPSVTDIFVASSHFDIRKMVCDLVGIPLNMGRNGNIYASQHHWKGLDGGGEASAMGDFSRRCVIH